MCVCVCVTMQSANVPDEQQEQILLEAQTRLAPYAHKTHWLRMLTPQAASAVPDRLDFVYVDARHDYCGVRHDTHTHTHTHTHTPARAYQARRCMS